MVWVQIPSREEQNTCVTSIPRFAFREKVTLGLLKFLLRECSQMRHTLPGDNYTIISLQWNGGVKDF
jgi:hypothetical protein